MRFCVILVSIFCAPACDEEQIPSCDPSDVENGTATLNLDGEALKYDSTWIMTGSTLQLNLEGIENNSMITMRLNQSDDGTTVTDLSSFPASFSLGDDQSGSATVYPPSASSSATTQADDIGSFELTTWDDTLMGCFAFTVLGQDGQILEVEGGLINAAESLLNQ